jgi:hypothetical protein
MGECSVQAWVSRRSEIGGGGGVWGVSGCACGCARGLPATGD